MLKMILYHANTERKVIVSMASKHLALVVKEILNFMSQLKKIGFMKQAEKSLMCLVQGRRIDVFRTKNKDKAFEKYYENNRTYLIRKRYVGNDVIRQWYDVYGERWIDE